MLQYLKLLSLSWKEISRQPILFRFDIGHSAVLTVKETIEFATKCTSSGTETDEEIDSHVDRLLTNLGLDHVADTVVGDENLRGISGGQKRRVTAGEMMTD